MKERLIWLDYVRAVGAVLVVLLHTAAPYLYKIKTIDGSSWLIGNFVDSFARVSVPLFFMISGYIFFGEKQPKLKNYLRLLSALIFYSAISLLYLKFYREAPIFQLIKNIAFKPVFYHLWFFYSLFVVYMIGNILTIRNVANNRVFLFVAILFILINPKLSNVNDLFNVPYAKSRIQLDGYVVYYILYAAFGAIIGNMSFSINRRVVSYGALLFYILSSVATGYGTFVVSSSAAKYVDTFYHYNGVLVAIGAFSIFTYIKESSTYIYLLDRPLRFLASNSLAIYGVHAVILDVMLREGYRDFDNPAIDIPLVFILTTLSSIFVAVFIKRVDRYCLVS